MLVIFILKGSRKKAKVIFEINETKEDQRSQSLLFLMCYSGLECMCRSFYICVNWSFCHLDCIFENWSHVCTFWKNTKFLHKKCREVNAQP